MDAIWLAAAFVAGLAVGVAYFAWLRRSVTALTGGGGEVRFAVMALLRVALIAALVASALASGVAAGHVLAAGLGFLVARFVATRAGTRANTLPRGR